MRQMLETDGISNSWSGGGGHNAVIIAPTPLPRTTCAHLTLARIIHNRPTASIAANNARTLFFALVRPSVTCALCTGVRYTLWPATPQLAACTVVWLMRAHALAACITLGLIAAAHPLPLTPSHSTTHVLFQALRVQRVAAIAERTIRAAVRFAQKILGGVPQW
jgi:hypothetical protein